MTSSIGLAKQTDFAPTPARSASFIITDSFPLCPQKCAPFRGKLVSPFFLLPSSPRSLVSVRLFFAPRTNFHFWRVLDELVRSVQPQAISVQRAPLQRSVRTGRLPPRFCFRLFYLRRPSGLADPCRR